MKSGILLFNIKNQVKLNKLFTFSGLTISRIQICSTNALLVLIEQKKYFKYIKTNIQNNHKNIVNVLTFVQITLECALNWRVIY